MKILSGIVGLGGIIAAGYASTYPLLAYVAYTAGLIEGLMWAYGDQR